MTFRRGPAYLNGLGEKSGHVVPGYRVREQLFQLSVILVGGLAVTLPAPTRSLNLHRRVPARLAAPDASVHVRAHGVMVVMAGRYVFEPGRRLGGELVQIARHAVITITDGYHVLVAGVQPGQIQRQLVRLGTAVDQIHGLEIVSHVLYKWARTCPKNGGIVKTATNRRR